MTITGGRVRPSVIRMRKKERPLGGGGGARARFPFKRWGFLPPLLMLVAPYFLQFLSLRRLTAGGPSIDVGDHPTPLPGRGGGPDHGASFRPLSDSVLPPTTIDGTSFPRGRNSRLYMGTGLWNSGMSLPSALGAMLGDGDAYVESPAFAACRLRLALGDDGDGSLEAALGREVFRSRDARRDWMGYYGFARDVRKFRRCVPSPGATASSADLARSILDARFRDASRAMDLAASLSSGDADEPADLLYATVHPYIAAQYYGPSLVVTRPDREGRGLDLGYYSAVKKLQRGGGDGVMKSCVDVPNRNLEPDVPDSGEVLFPGYRRPSDVVGFEVRREASHSDERKVQDLPPQMGGRSVPSITHAFYARDVPGAGRAVFFLSFPPGRVHCVAEPEDDGRAGDESNAGTFFECNHGGRPVGGAVNLNGSSCVMTNDMAPIPSKPLGTLGLVFAEGNFAGGCAAAGRALEGLPPEHRGVPTNATEDYLRSQGFRDVLSSASSRLGEGVFVAQFTPGGEVECSRVVVGGADDLWQSHRNMAASHIGMDARLAMCMARVPATWQGGKDDGAAGPWKANVTSNHQSNPLGSDAFGVQSARPAPDLTKAPNWRRLLDPILDANGLTVNSHSHPCWGYMGSTCDVDLVLAAHDQRNGTDAMTTAGDAEELRRLQCALECTYAGVWLAPPDAPPPCHWLARDLIVPIAENPDSPMGFEHLVAAKMNGDKVERRLLTQGEADPLHFPPPSHTGRGSMNVVLTSDVHGFVHGACDGGMAPGLCSSGAPSLASVLDTVRLSSSVTRSPVLVLDAGDALHGSGVAPGDVVSVMNVLGVDAMALGNHELDLGAEGLRDAAGRAGFPVLAANVDGLPFLGKSLSRHARIGGSQCMVRVVGLSAPEPNPLAGKNFTFANDSAVAILERELAVDGNARCTVNILLSHLGYKEDVAIARNVAATASCSLDLILGGHSHVVFGGEKGRPTSPRIVGGGGNSGTIVHRSFPHVDGVPIAHVGANGLYVGLFSIKPHWEGGPSSGHRASLAPRFVVRGTLQALGVEDGVFPQKMALPRPQKAADARPILVKTHPDEFSVCNVGCRRDECLAGNFVANAMRQCILDERCWGAKSSHPIIALLESGTLRGCIKHAQDDMTEMLPWSNELVLLTVKGSTILAMLEHGVKSKVDLQGGGFLQTSGLRYRYRGRKVLSVWESEPPTKKRHHPAERAPLDPTIAFNSRVLEERVPVKVLDYDALYNIVVTDWLAFGGDGFGPIVAESVEIVHTNTTLKSAVFRYSMQQPIVQIEMRSQNADNEAGAGLLRWLSAFVGSLMATICSYPLYSMAVLRATSRKSPGKLYDGVVLASFATAMSNAFFYLFYHILSFNSPMIRSVLGAVLNVILTNPLWVVITRIQTRKQTQPFNQFNSIFHTAIELICDEGYSGFFDGLVFNLIMCIYPSIRQLSLEVFQTLVLPNYGSPSHAVTGLCGMAASCIANFITWPIQRWRVRQQAAVHDNERANHWTGLCDGVVFKVLHSCVAGFIFFAVMSASSEMLDIVLG